MRFFSSLRTFRPSLARTQPTRCFATSTPKRLSEPDPKAIPAAEAMQSTEDQASMVVAEQVPSGTLGTYHPEHQPDYNAHVDHGTGSYSPVPRRVMDGSEPGNTLPAAVLSGAPVDLQARTVR